MTGWRVAVWAALTLTVGLLRDWRTWAAVGIGAAAGLAARLFVCLVFVALGGLP